MFKCDMCHISGHLLGYTIHVGITTIEVCFPCLCKLRCGNQVVNCLGCSDDYSRRDIISTQFGAMCKQCEESAVACTFCNRPIWDGDIYIYDSKPYCSQCLRNQFPECDRCGSRAPRDETYIDSRGNTICQNCFENDYATCENCGEIYDNNNIEIIDGRFLCTDCARDVYSPLEYGYKPELIFYHLPDEEKQKRFFGVEIEIDRGANDVTPSGGEFLATVKNETDYYCIKHDGSLTSCGMEIVTQPMTLRYWRQDTIINNVLTIARKYHFRGETAERTGLHIHVSRNSASLYTWAKVAVFWYDDRHDTFLRDICRRGNNSYCEKKSVKNKTCQDVVTNYDMSHYDAINFCNDATVEFRQFKGAINITTILASIQLVDAVIKFCQTCTLHQISTQTNVKFLVAFIRKHPKLYSHLITLLEAKGY